MTTETERTALVERHALALMDDGSPSGPDECRYVTLAMVRSTIAAAVADALASAPSAPQPADPYASMLELKPDWDSYGAAPIDTRAIEAAKSFEATFWRVPTCNGGVQLEWHALGLDLEVALATDGSVESVYARHPIGEVELPIPASQEEPSQGQERTALILRLNKAVTGALRSAVAAHGPITAGLIPSATKRVTGVLCANDGVLEALSSSAPRSKPCVSTEPM